MSKIRDRIETVVGKRLRTAMSQARLDVEALADKSGISASGIKKLRNGKTRTARATTLEALAKALSVPVDFFTKEINDHLFDNVGDDLAILEKTYGPSVRSSLQFGDYRTLWLAYDTVSTSRYGFENVFANITDRDPKLSPAFTKLRSHIEQINAELEKDPSKGKPFFDGPTVCLSRYNLNHTADGHEHKILSVDFARSRYANNVTAKSGTAANLRKRELGKFKFLDQPIEWLASGVGVAIVVFCEGGKRFITARRSEHERFRSLEFDISVVEGINPIKDRNVSEPNRIYVHDVAKRALFAELGIKVPLENIFVFGFGVDLEYYQWNFLAYANVDLTFRK